MTAFLFIPSTTGAGPGRRVDFANIASLFGDAEPAPVLRESGQLARILMMLLVLIGAVGDTFLVTRADTIAKCVSTTEPAAASTVHGTNS